MDVRLPGVFDLEDRVPSELPCPSWGHDLALDAPFKQDWLRSGPCAVRKCAERRGSCCRESLQKGVQAYAIHRGELYYKT